MHSYIATLHYPVRFVLLACVLAWLTPGGAFAETVDVKREHAAFSMEFRDADIKDVLRAVGQAANLNMIVSDAVTGQVSLSLKDVDMWDALESILKTKGLTYVREGNIVRVVAVSEARDEDMETRIFPLGYANGKDVLGVVEKIKSEKAKISADARMNALVVKDLSLNIDKMERLLKNLDMRIPQVLIEAKVVEVASNYAQELGIQWGGKYSGSSSHGTTVISGGSTGIGSSITGGTVPPIGSTVLYPSTGDIGPSGNAYVVNLPAAIGSGSGGVLGVTFGKLGGRLTLDLQLSAMQSTGNGKILSSPKILTVNNKEAKISSGIDIPVKVVSTTTVGTTADVKTITASLLLSTVPTITQDNRIALNIKVEKAEPDFSQVVDGIPTVTRRNAYAEVVVNNGETVVLGGIYTKSEGQSEAGVPFLSKIPVLGWLFKKKSNFEKQAELLIFITPTIVED
jgi:type IV pilus assembly protein PilQ